MSHVSVTYADRLPESHYTLAFEPYIYNQESFLQLKNYPIQSFYAVNRETQSVVARMHVALLVSSDGQKQAISLPELPFGSLEYGTGITPAQLSGFVGYVQEQLARQEITSLEIRDCIPAYRADRGTLLHQTLAARGATILEETANHHIWVDTTPFTEKMHAMEARRLKKCHRAGFTFQPEPLTKLESIYRFILLCRTAQGWSLSLSLSQLTRMAAEFPDAYILFAVYDQDQPVAATICLRVNDRLLYHFYPASHPDYRQFSPMVYLLQQLYAYSTQHHIDLIDLGTSVSPSLAAFKKHVGGALSYKKTYLLAL